MLINPSLRTAPLPDLVITKMDPKEPLNQITDSVTLNVEVANRGNAPAGSFQVEVAVQGRDDKKTAQVKSLAAGASTKVTMGALPLQWLGNQLLTIDATADSLNQVPESDKTNNWMELFLTAPQQPQPQPPNPWPPTPPVPHPHGSR